MCPRMCGVNRKEQTGFCGAGDSVRVSRASLHMWEEPCISGKNGSGTIFFSGCSLKCCFCQNYKISAENFGKDISKEKLCDIMLDLQSQGAHNINLVTPTHYAHKIADALTKVKDKLKIPVVYNSSGYENTDTLDMLAGLVDIYMPDLKYFSQELSKKYSGAENYFKKASEAILYMHKQVGAVEFDDEKMMKNGLIIRHMLLPGAYRDSLKILDWIGENFDKEKIMISLMCQYTPSYKSDRFGEINRKVTSFEYNKVIERALLLGLKGCMQQRSSASESYVPDFDLRGIE